MTGPTHRDLCRITASWALAQSWGWAAAFEVGIDGGVADVIAITDPAITWSPEHAAAHAAWKTEWLAAYRAETAAQCAQLAQPTVDQALKSWHLRRETARRDADVRVPRLWADIADKPSRPRVTVIEVKRTRTDLRRDLRAGKMLAYEQTGQACYLAATTEALGDLTTKGDRDAALADLADRGLPKSWGVVHLHVGSWGQGAVQFGDDWWRGFVLRPVRGAREASAGELARAHRWITRSLSHRVVADRL